MKELKVTSVETASQENQCENSPMNSTAGAFVTAAGQSSQTMCSGDVMMTALHIRADGSRYCYHKPPRDGCGACWDKKVSELESQLTQVRGELTSVVADSKELQLMIEDDDKEIDKLQEELTQVRSELEQMHELSKRQIECFEEAELIRGKAQEEIKRLREDVNKLVALRQKFHKEGA